ncbi:hypothetical protein BRADI_1g48595v3 [Brachypodium distachyon]|uniref:Uncharacterized protein n=1 Tax=Brachypodium distachyon TaxID=15368 RepID=A0A0Q3K4R5_BRADI|nr:hypothetical protein BRADI_1g48595v3 [Brachypodium distachyon]
MASPRRRPRLWPRPRSHQAPRAQDADLAITGSTAQTPTPTSSSQAPPPRRPRPQPRLHRLLHRADSDLAVAGPPRRPALPRAPPPLHSAELAVVSLPRLPLSTLVGFYTSQLPHSREDWWTTERKYASKLLRRDFDTITILIHWRIWKERNARIFQQESCSADSVVKLIIDELQSWKVARCVLAF